MASARRRRRWDGEKGPFEKLIQRIVDEQEWDSVRALALAAGLSATCLQTRIHYERTLGSAQLSGDTVRKLAKVTNLDPALFISVSEPNVALEDSLGRFVVSRNRDSLDAARRVVAALVDDGIPEADALAATGAVILGDPVWDGDVIQAYKRAKRRIEESAETAAADQAAKQSGVRLKRNDRKVV